MSYNHNIRPIPVTVVTGSVNRERGEEMVTPFPESFIAAGRSELGLKQGEIKWMIMDSEKEGDDFRSPQRLVRVRDGCTGGLCRRTRKSAQIVKY